MSVTGLQFTSLKPTGAFTITSIHVSTFQRIQKMYFHV